MNKVLKLCLSEDEADKVIGKELVSKNKELQEHFSNIALYTGPRSELNTTPTFKKSFESEEKNDGAYKLYCAVFNSLPPHIMKEIEKKWNNWQRSNRARDLYELPSRGEWYPEALKSIKILMKDE